MSLLEIKNIVKHFGGVRAVDGLTMACRPGEITAVIGPNGSGKTTLTHLLSGATPFDGGHIVVAGERIDNLRPHEASEYGITRTFQEVRVFEQMTVLDNILVVLTPRSVFESLSLRHSKLYRERAEELLKLVNLAEKQHQLARQLSYGQRKLLEVARALAMKADIYLFDEPFAGLFPQMVETLVSVLKDLRQKDKTIVLIEHNMKLVRLLADRVIVLDAGALLAEGKPDHVLTEKKVIEAYLGE